MKKLLLGLVAGVFVFAGASAALAAHNADGLVGYWNLDEGSGLTALDGSGHGYNGVVAGADYEGSGTPAVAGNVDSLTFDGVDDVVTVTDNDDLDIQNELTISFWFRLDGQSSDNAWPRPVTKGQTTTSDGAYGVFVKDSRDATDIGLRFVDTGNVTHDVRATSLDSYNDHAWHHVVAVYSSAGEFGKLYVDGDEVKHVDIPGGVLIRSTDDDLTIGAGLGDADRHFNGGVDEVLIYNRALTLEEVTDLYTDGSVTGNPVEKVSCKKGGWEAFGFRNQGLCIQFINTGKDSR